MTMGYSIVGPDDVAPATLESLQDIQAGKYFFLAALTVLLYDHFLTLADEVDLIWKRKKSYVLYLFLTVRYYALIAVVVVAFGFFSPEMTRERCSRWMLFLPLGITIPLTILPGILMVVRVYALYNRNVYVLVCLSLALCLQTGAGLWQYTVKGATPAPDPLDNYEYHFCIYLPPKRIGHLSILFISLELAFDSVVFLLTISRTLYVHYLDKKDSEGDSTLVQNLIRDGAFYFAVIFSFNLSWVLMISLAPTGLRAIASLPSACITTIMICRITLNLRTTAYGTAAYDEQTTGSLQLTDLPRRRSRYRSGVRRSSALRAPSSTSSSLHIGVQVQTRTTIDRANSYGQLSGSAGIQRPRVVRYNDAYDDDAHLGLGGAGASPAFADRYSNSPSFASGSGWRLSEPPSFVSRELREAGYGTIPESPISSTLTTYAFASQGESSPRDESFHHLRSGSSVSMYGPTDMEWKRKSDATWTM
ncbi:hypothetical protein PENSPDRAFT_748291 [Peniophora sp. CONT]|nr:hypothetical protein PENSPDRAFT_748291 [Peniophora sp. CONT]